MRNAFASAVTELASSEKRLVLLSGDIGNRLFDDFKSRHADRFYNCGVAEANMTGMAAGLALGGLKPVTYTITPFAVMRCLEQIRVDVCYQNLPVIIVGTGSGLSYAGLGATHHSLDDIAVLRSFPNLTILCPADPVEVRLALKAALGLDGPAYLRIGKKGEPTVHQADPVFTIGEPITVRSGKSLCILSTGNTLPLALECAALLEQQGLSCRVDSFHTVKPLNFSALESVFAQFPLVVTLEEHALIGGFGSAVAEWRADAGPAARLLRIGTPDHFLHTAGGQQYARQTFGLTPEAILQKILHGLDHAS